MIRGKDIAAMVGVSRQAVTAVLNNSRPNCVSPEKRAEILKIAAEYNYHPNHAAKALKTGKSNLIGVVMPQWQNPYIAGLCMALQRALAARNYTPFFTIDNNYNPVPGNLEQLLSLQVAGLITVASSLLPDNMDIPVVSYFGDDPRFDSLCPNVEEKFRILLEYLKECGHKKIGYIGWSNDLHARELNEKAAYYGMELQPRWQLGKPHPINADLFDLLLEENRGKDLPTVLIVNNDDLALKLMLRIRERGYRIPEDFSIIGNDNVAHCAIAFPALTSMSSGSYDEIAGAMVDLLMKRIKDPFRPREKVLLKNELIKRDSVAVITK